MVFLWCLNDGKSPQVSRTLLSVLVNLNNAVVWMVSTHPLISRSSSPFNNSLVTVPRALITIGTILTFIFYPFFQSPNKAKVLHFLSTLLIGQLGQQSPQFGKFSFLLLVIVRSGRLADIKWSICASNFQMSNCLILQDRFWVVNILLLL